MTEKIINIDRMEQAVALFGTFDENIKLIQNEYMVSVVCRDSELKVSGEIENVAKASKVIESLQLTKAVRSFFDLWLAMCGIFVYSLVLKTGREFGHI